MGSRVGGDTQKKSGEGAPRNSRNYRLKDMRGGGGKKLLSTPAPPPTPILTASLRKFLSCVMFRSIQNSLALQMAPQTADHLRSNILLIFLGVSDTPGATHLISPKRPVPRGVLRASQKKTRKRKKLFFQLFAVKSLFPVFHCSRSSGNCGVRLLYHPSPCEVNI